MGFMWRRCTIQHRKAMSVPSQAQRYMCTRYVYICGYVQELGRRHTRRRARSSPVRAAALEQQRLNPWPGSA